MTIFTKEIINKRYQTFIKGGEKIRLGVAVTLINQNKEVLLERRSDCGWWGITGGGIEIGETVEECAIREIKEECNIEITKKSLHLVDIYSNPKHGRVVQYPDNRIHLIDVIYFSKTNETVFKTSEESFELKFFNFNNLPKLLIPPSINPLTDISKLI
tara:strand:+ start:151 stop:624 length:474 start_codon:yes stop_codon:yes gene_type:complete